jgi:uncharacterized ion transporter superfamily protein YfcC
MVLTWFVPSGTFSTGTFVSNGINPAGIFDFIVFIYYSLSYKAMDIIYILTIGGAYGVLSNVGAYRKLVDKTARFIKKNDVLALCIATLIVGLYTSITSDILIIIGIAPFIVTSFLKAKKDRLTALSAGFGGLFIGLIGKTVGTFGVSSLLTGLKITASSLIGYKIILFVYISFSTLLSAQFVAPSRAPVVPPPSSALAPRGPGTVACSAPSSGSWPVVARGVVPASRRGVASA